MEKDDEVKGEGNEYATFYRQLDPRVGRWFSLDPVIKAEMSPYVSMSNNPVRRVDPNGDDDYFDSKGNFLFSTGYGDEVRVVKSDSEASILLNTAFEIFQNVDHVGCREELVTHHLRGAEGTKNLTDYKFQSSKAPSKILTHYGEKILSRGKNIQATSKYGGVGVMGVSARRDQYVNNESNRGNLLGASPQIYTPLVTNRDNGEVGFMVDNLLSTISNITSVITHENHHLENHVKYYSDGLYEYLNVEEGLSGVMNHLESYNTQIDDPSYANTTTEFKKNTAVNISILINKVQDDKIREELHNSFEKRLDNYDRTYTNDNWYQRAKTEQNN